MAGMALRAAAVAAAVALQIACAAIVWGGGGAAAEKVYTRTFRSPEIHLAPGDCYDKMLTVEMPEGHIALRSFNTQVVDENGVPIPLQETYLHHWTLHRFYAHSTTSGLREPVLASNAGVCDNAQLAQLFGLGSETRHTETNIPAPYGIEIGDPETLPAGYDAIWRLNVHAIDTRGAVDARGCTECLCELYNMTVENGMDIPEDYIGGLECCRDNTHCAVKPGFQGPKRKIFMEYYVKWVEMSDEVVPVKVYIFDVTDQKSATNGRDKCAVEYNVFKCAEGESPCIQKDENVNFLPVGGDIIYAVAHQHAGGVGSTLYNSDGSEICSSIPTYGNGTEPGNEVGYITGMTVCFPQPGVVKVRAGEPLRLTSWYNNEDRHTGVMGLFYILVDESAALPPAPEPGSGSRWMLTVAALIAAVTLIATIVTHHLKTNKKGPEYERLPLASH